MARYTYSSNTSRSRHFFVLTCLPYAFRLLPCDPNLVRWSFVRHGGEKQGGASGWVGRCLLTCQPTLPSKPKPVQVFHPFFVVFVRELNEMTTKPHRSLLVATMDESPPESASVCRRYVEVVYPEQAFPFTKCPFFSCNEWEMLRLSSTCFPFCSWDRVGGGVFFLSLSFSFVLTYNPMQSNVSNVGTMAHIKNKKERNVAKETPWHFYMHAF